MPIDPNKAYNVPQPRAYAPPVPRAPAPTPQPVASMPPVPGVPPPSTGGGGATAGSDRNRTGGNPPLPGTQQQGQEPWVGSFGNYQNWANQFQAEHGRAPNEQDYYDLMDSQNFLAQTGRAPTQREWLNRYYTGTWSGTGGGYGGGGGGGGYGGYGGYGGRQQAGPWSPGMYFWNYGR